MLECQGDELNFQTKVELACMARANELLTHCTLGVPLKCQASVERLVATGRRPNTPLTWYTLTRHHSTCGDTQTDLRQDEVWCGVQTGSKEPVWEAVQTASQTGSQEPVWEAVQTASQTASQTGSQEPVWEAVWTAPGRGFPGSWETTRKPEIRVFSQVPGNRRFGGVLGREGSSRSSIPYSIYISQFQTGTPKPRYIGFRDGGRENGTQNGQFRPVFGHILWPLSGPSLFHEIRDFSRPRARFLTFREKS